ncbi:hypothetical protein SGRI78S_03141 [Streptomyces griseus subsp. griseus]
MPHLGLVTTFQPGTTGLGSLSEPRGFSAGGAEPLSAPLGWALGDADFLSSATALPPSSSLPSTRKPVTPAVITTAVAATIATIVVFFLSSPGFGPPGGPGTAYCGAVGCW